MKSEDFFRELDTLLKSGSRTIPNSDIDIEALHLSGALRKKIESRNNMLAITILLLIVVVAAAALFFLLPDFQKKLGLGANMEIVKDPGAEVQIKQLNYEKEELMEGIDSLRKQIELLKSAPPPPAETKLAATDSQNEIGADGIIRHVVDKGETLYRLAEKYYGNGLLYGTLQSDNKLKVPEDLAEGMTLKIYPEKRQPKSN